MDATDVQNRQRAQLAQWAMRTVGQAILVSIAAALVVAVIGVVMDSGTVLAFSPLIGFGVFGLILAGADAPRPPTG